MPAGDDIARKIDLLVDREYDAHSPGAVILLARGERVLYRREVGMANLELGVPLAPEMVFRIASFTKPFTAQAVLLLAEDGKLHVQDEVDQYLPGIQAFSGITIEHLLTHTSGLMNYTDLPEWWAGHRQELSVMDLVGLFKNRPRVSVPGTCWAYNNSGYVLLGAILEVITGMPYGRFVQHRIFDPLEMAHSEYEDASRIVPGRVSGYQLAGDAFQNAEPISVTQVYAAGGLLSTIDDLARWSRALFAGRILKPETMRRSFAPFLLQDGSPTRYGYGWFLGALGGIPLVEHLGSLPGYAHYMIGAPAQQLFTAVLSNRAVQQTVPETLARSIMELGLAEEAMDHAAS
jgi:D-alanyl-D-alanine carboxypeptidase